MRIYFVAIGVVTSALLSFSTQAQDLRDVIAAAQD